MPWRTEKDQKTELTEVVIAKKQPFPTGPGEQWSGSVVSESGRLEKGTCRLGIPSLMDAEGAWRQGSPNWNLGLWRAALQVSLGNVGDWLC